MHAALKGSMPSLVWRKPVSLQVNVLKAARCHVWVATRGSTQPPGLSKFTTFKM